ncbi:MAG: cyclic beta 1-2 glucan synthetase [Verrucomicrobia bacterium]|nr:cyclic beta 1-2 glucan synthetase [Verrucomicrobiota bacterium]
MKLAQILGYLEFRRQSLSLPEDGNSSESWSRIGEGDRPAENGSSSRFGNPINHLPGDADVGGLMGVDALVHLARTLVSQHRLGPRKGPDRLLPRLDENERVLSQHHQELLNDTGSSQRAPAAEWLLDNYYVIKEQIRLARRHLPRGFSRELPHLADGPCANFPRVYELARQLVGHVDGRVDGEHLNRFIQAYQEHASLKLGELWAIPIMLRLALIENLRRVATEVSRARLEQLEAGRWADQMLEVAERDSSRLIVAVARMVEAAGRPSPAFMVEFWRRTQGRLPALAPVSGWVEVWLKGEGTRIEQLIHSETQRQAAEQVSVGNSITSLRLLQSLDWREFVEAHSVVEQELRKDPAGTYPLMDFGTRDHYRHAVERMARHSDCDELEVARQAVRLSDQAGRNPSNRDGHVGFFLMDGGRTALEEAVAYRPPFADRLERHFRNHALLGYLGGVGLITLMVWGAGVIQWSRGSPEMLPGIWIAGCLLLVGSQLGVALVNWWATRAIRPDVLPRLDFGEGIPDSHRCLIAVPCLLTDPATIEGLINNLEIHHLGNRDPNVFLALLTDLPDASQAQLPGDAGKVEQARQGLAGLNARYQVGAVPRFYLFHRERRWNAQERIWMGYERKRGKLRQLNRCLRGVAEEDVQVLVGDLSRLPSIRYVITLDADTQLPRDAARQLAGSMAHPLNRPHYDSSRGRVTEGYGILQPRVAVSLPSASRSLFARLFAGEPGLDPYTRSVSDVYQDLFHEGSFIGKGIYDVDAFERALEERFPENRILSHDLIEGSYARSGLVSDVVLFEGFPARYTADTRRRHRWIRGDWQIATWLLPRVPGSDVRQVANPINALSRWKIFDNLRRSLVPVALLSLLVAGWFLPSLAASLAWTLGLLVVVLLPGLLASLTSIVTKPDDVPWRAQIYQTGRTFLEQICQGLLTVIFLPYDAWVCLDATLRTLARLAFTRRHLLEWQTSGEIEGREPTELAAYARTMMSAPSAAIATGLAVLAFQPAGAWVSVPFLVGWFAAPWIGWRISQPISEQRTPLNREQIQFLRRIARQTWAYFDTWMNQEEHGLPPDNFQEYPQPIVATRTSPTNIGMGLLSGLTAWDLGYLSTGRFLDRIEDCLRTLQELPRHEGHFFNWYDTRTLQAMAPSYLSTVDNGNLAAMLLVLRSGVKEVRDSNPLDTPVFSGLLDTLAVLRESLGSPRSKNRRAWLTSLETLLQSPPLLVSERMDRLQAIMGTLALEPSTEEVTSEYAFWRSELERQCRDHWQDWQRRCPWLERRAEVEAHPNELLQKLWRALNSAAEWNVPATEALLRAYLNSTESASSPERELGNALARDWENAVRQHSNEQARAEKLMTCCDGLARMDFSLLFDRTRELFSIGYNVAHHKLDSSCYDLLASEARLTSLVGIALGQVPKEHWFALGRQLTSVGGRPVLISWSGSMFEYLMPALITPSYDQTLLDASCRGAIRRQMEYGRELGLPWGVSESGYHLTDAQANYQYRAFGVPGLGFQRGLGDDQVIAPYASAMAVLFEPVAAVRNLHRLRDRGALGRFGFYEALDFTPARRPPGKPVAIVRSYMAHHQGMTLLGLAGVVLDRPMARRFLASPEFKSVELLLQERMPRESTYHLPDELAAPGTVAEAVLTPEAGFQVFKDPRGPTPEVHLLSNGRYHVMVTSAGAGYSRWNDFMLTRWREDTTRDAEGTFIYLRERGESQLWSVADQPTLQRTAAYEAIFSQGRAEFRDRRNDLEQYTEVSVSPEDDVEVRRVTLTNHTGRTRFIEVTTYSEVVLASAAADAAHPAFGKLFVETRILRAQQAILGTRRRRVATEQPPWAFQMLLLNGASGTPASFETDRLKFLGRNRSTRSPEALNGRVRSLSGTEGAVLDPILSIRRVVEVPAHGEARVTLVMGCGATEEGVRALVEKYQDPSLSDRVFDLAWTHGMVTLRHLNITETQAHLFGSLAGAVLYSQARWRASAALIQQNQRSQRGLWSLGISGDLPIVLLRASQVGQMVLLREVLQMHAFWRLKGLLADLVLVNEDESTYRQNVHDQIMGLVASGIGAKELDRPGGVFVRRREQIRPEEFALLQSAARIVLRDDLGSLTEQGRRRVRTPVMPAVHEPSRRRGPQTEPEPTVGPVLQFENGYGGFSPKGDEYVIHLPPGQETPAPWVNVIANPDFGTICSESGSTYTWAENCHEYRLTPWGNDPVCDRSGEALYLRDEETGRFWSPTPQPARGETPYLTRHGFGYTVYEHSEEGLTSEVWVYVDVEDPVKFVRLKLRNTSRRSRSLTAWAYWEWVLGEHRASQVMHHVTDYEEATGLLWIRNAYHSDLGDRCAVVGGSGTVASFTGDRNEFIGRNGDLSDPAALHRVGLSNRFGAALDSCAALQMAVQLGPGEETELVFCLGSSSDPQRLRTAFAKARSVAGARSALARVHHQWQQVLGAVQVETPHRSVNLLVNGWLPYQVLSSRLWARSGFYQSGGAFGFRDQLQDAMALVHARPDLLREQILRAASRQFREGDVQHWWHPPTLRGVRTRFSDDFLWLPLAVIRYVEITGDHSLLAESVPYLEGRPLRDEEEAFYDQPNTSTEVASIYDHCGRALRLGLRFGAHGLPLMGCGDWNDGMNRVGHEGKGESVWLAFFLYDILIRFAVLAEREGDGTWAVTCREQATRLRQATEQYGWDGRWYRRAYFDDGEPLGSSRNVECQIDALPQAWAVLSGLAEPGRQKTALASVAHRLVHRDGGLIQLFDPPFSEGTLDPGYIKGYVPGVRENGGQYTHAAVWTVMAFAMAGEKSLSWELFDLIDPIRHGGSPEAIERYRVEPYVLAADVYGVEPHTGRGGWTWYTGSAGWMYRLLVETFLGLQREGSRIRFTPRVPASWSGVRIRYRFGTTEYVFAFQTGTPEPGGPRFSLDGTPGERGQDWLELVDDQREHQVDVWPFADRDGGPLA